MGLHSRKGSSGCVKTGIATSQRTHGAACKEGK